MSVLVTNGELGHALAITRSLGKRGIDVAVGANTPDAITFFWNLLKKMRLIMEKSIYLTNSFK